MQQIIQIFPQCNNSHQLTVTNRVNIFVDDRIRTAKQVVFFVRISNTVRVCPFGRFSLYGQNGVMINFHVIFFYSMEQSSLCKSESRLAGPEIHAISKIHHGVYMNSSQHPILSNLIQDTLSQSNQSGTSVKQTTLNKIRFHEFYNVGYLICLRCFPNQLPIHNVLNNTLYLSTLRLYITIGLHY